MAVIDNYGEQAAKELAAFQDRLIEELLDEHGLKELNKDELERRGYYLDIYREPQLGGIQILQIRLLRLVGEKKARTYVSIQWKEES